MSALRGKIYSDSVEYEFMTPDQLTVENDRLKRIIDRLPSGPEKDEMRSKREDVVRARWSKIKNINPKIRDYVILANKILDNFFKLNPQKRVKR